MRITFNLLKSNKIVKFAYLILRSTAYKTVKLGPVRRATQHKPIFNRSGLQSPINTATFLGPELAFNLRNTHNKIRKQYYFLKNKILQFPHKMTDIKDVIIPSCAFEYVQCYSVGPCTSAIPSIERSKRKISLLDPNLVVRKHYETIKFRELLHLTFMGSCIVVIFQYISKMMQCYAVYFIWKLLYMFRVVPSPIIRSANKCI
jgi:hypothetical protein